MGTLFSDVNTIFLRKITDFYLANQFASTPTIAENEIYGFMESASVKFSKSKVNLFDVNLLLKQFNQTLGIYEKEILALFMCHEWCEPEIKNLLNLRQLLNDTDFKIGSQHLMLKALIDFRKDSWDEAQYQMFQYTYDTSNPSLNTVNNLSDLG